MNQDGYIRQLEEKIQILLTLNEKLQQENEALKNRLHFYENPHTPPSENTLKKQKKDSLEPDILPKKLGAPIGHKGATRPRKLPIEIKDVINPKCEKCGSENIEKQEKFVEKVIEDLQPPPKPKIIGYKLWEVKCRDCGHQSISKDKDCPQKGNFGIFLIVYITMLKFHLRGVIRKIQDFLQYNDDFEISVKGIQDVLLRVGDSCKNEYFRKLEKIRNAKWRHIDETCVKINGVKWWLWIFRTNDNETLVVIRKSRGKKVLEEILGKDHKGPDIVDGWPSYDWISILQRCWAHLLREVDDVIEISENGKKLSEDIHACFKSLKEYLAKDPSLDERTKKKEEFDKELENIVAKYADCKELHKPLTYLRNGFGRWYTCLLYPGMEPTNNLGEQAMREHVIMRKIIGCFRSEKGAENYQYIASLLATWRLQGKNGFEELEGLLRQELCLS